MTTCVDLRWLAKRSRKLTRKNTQLWRRAIVLVTGSLTSIELRLLAGKFELDQGDRK